MLNHDGDNIDNDEEHIDDQHDDDDQHKGARQKLLSGFCPLRGYPLNGQSFCQKTLSGQGGYPPP